MNECKWREYGDDLHDRSWSTSCGEDFCLIDGTPSENLYNFCPNCGGKLIEEPSE